MQIQQKSNYNCFALSMYTNPINPYIKMQIQSNYNSFLSNTNGTPHKLNKSYQIITAIDPLKLHKSDAMQPMS